MLSAYQLACGYMELKEANNIRVKLYREHGVYFIIAYDHNNHRSLDNASTVVLTHARKTFRQFCTSFFPAK